MSMDNVTALPIFAPPEIIPRKIPTLQGFWPEGATVEEAEYLVEGWLPEKSDIYLYGRHGSLKTFLLVHMAFCGALGWDMMGNRVRERFGSIICCGEKKARFGKRIVAWMVANNVTDSPAVFVRDGCPDLTNPDAVADFIEEVNGAKAQFEARGAPLRMIGLDTLSRALKAGNVSDATTAGDAINAIQRIIDETGCTVISTAHVAKAEGSDSIKGAGEFGDSAVTYIHLERDKQAQVVTATLKKQSDGPDGLQFAFAFQPVVVGKGRHGDISSGAIVEADVPDAPKGGRPATKGDDQANLVMLAFNRAFDERSAPIRALGASGAHGVELHRLREWAVDHLQFGGLPPVREADTSEGDHAKILRTWRSTRNQAFNRAVERLEGAKRLRIENGWVWEPHAKPGAGR